MAYAAAAEAESQSRRLRRTQLIGVFVLAGVLLAAPMITITGNYDADDDVTLSVWSAISYFSDHGTDHTDQAPTTFRLLTLGLVAAIIFAFIAMIVSLVLAINRGTPARVAAITVAVIGVLATVFNLLATTIDLPNDYGKLHPGLGLLLPAALGLWTANMLQTD